MNSVPTVLAQSGFNWNMLFSTPTIIFVVGGAIAISAIVACNLRGHSESKQLNRLKADMIERGFSADEIARIIESGRDSSGKGASSSGGKS